MTITDTGTYLKIATGSYLFYFFYGDLLPKVKGDSIAFINKYNNQSMGAVDYSDITLVGIAGTTDAEELAAYLMSL